MIRNQRELEFVKEQLRLTKISSYQRQLSNMAEKLADDPIERERNELIIQELEKQLELLQSCN
ncbi:hypothetical protein [Scytonema sp. NUACC26]|uniref:hypothetical protein n=1 Tax=Scytonema sp. NUACC26 TaxID=3140176 RepID=UPI0034DC38F9